MVSARSDQRQVLLFGEVCHQAVRLTNKFFFTLAHASNCSAFQYVSMPYVGTRTGWFFAVKFGTAESRRE